MNHEEAVPYLSDQVRGRLDESRAREVLAHARGCADCTGVLATLEQVRAVVAHDGGALFTPHPESAVLARLAAAPGDLGASDRERLEDHVRTCPTCAHELAQSRAAIRSTAWRGVLESFVGGPTPQAWLRPALALLVLGLAYPAYIGLVEYPRAAGERDAARRALRQRPAPAPPPPVGPAAAGGAARALVLSNVTRSSGGAIASVELAPGQEWLPLILDHTSALGDLDRVLEVTILNASGGVAWGTRGTARSLRDPGTAAIVLLVPAARLDAGAYSVRLHHERESPLFSARFRVRSGTSPKP